jgi:hypothetical protein
MPDQFESLRLGSSADFVFRGWRSNGNASNAKLNEKLRPKGEQLFARVYRTPMKRTSITTSDELFQNVPLKPAFERGFHILSY